MAARQLAQSTLKRSMLEKANGACPDTAAGRPEPIETDSEGAKTDTEEQEQEGQAHRPKQGTSWAQTAQQGASGMQQDPSSAPVRAHLTETAVT